MSRPVTRETLRRQLQACLDDASSTRFWVRRSSKAQFGEFVSNIALVVAAQTRQPVASVAQRLMQQMSWAGLVEERKGFLNFRMNDETLRSTVEAALQQGERFGAGDSLQNRRVVVEFVSADPSGPLPFSLSRMAAVGEAICRLLALQGANVTREFYLNDDETSAKMKLLGESVASHYLTILGQPHEPPEGMLDDAFVRSVAESIAERDGSAHLLVPDEERAARFAHQAVESAVQMQKSSLNRFGVRFDVWTSEAALKRENRVENAIAKLRERGLLYERDGAQWLQTSKFGDEADRVLVRANGRPTYLASDIAYHVFKAERGFDLLLNVWTGEHRPYVERTRAALASAGCDAEKFEVLPCEGARFLKDGRPVSRGKSGGAWSLDDALDELDADTLKFFLLRQNADERVAVDDEIARRDDETNAAYAVRLLPSRLQTMIAPVQNAPVENTQIEYSIEEREVVRLVALWPDTVENAALERAPHRVASFLSDLSKAVCDALKTSRPNSPAASMDVLRAALVVSQNALHVLGMSGAKI